MIKRIELLCLSLLFGLGLGRAASAAPGETKWVFKAGGAVRSAPAIRPDGTVVFGSEDKIVYALDPSSGTRRWSFLTAGRVSGSPAIGDDGTVFIGSTDQRFYALEGSTGSKRWSFTAGGPIPGTPAIGADSTVYFTALDRMVYALDGATGAKKWTRDMRALVLNPPAIGPDGTVYLGTEGQIVFALDGSTGEPRWHYPVDTAGLGGDGSPVVIGPDGTVYSGLDQRTALSALHGATGEPRWIFQDSREKYGDFRTICDSTGVLFFRRVGIGKTTLAALDQETGAVRWQIDAGPGQAPALGGDGMLYDVGSGGALRAIDSNTGVVRWSSNVGGSIPGSPTVSGDGTIYFGAEDGKVYAIEGGAGPAESGWPMFGGNALHQGRLVTQTPPAILRAPTSQVGVLGSRVRLAVSAGGTGRLNYRWQKDGKDLGVAGRVVGVDASVLIITDLQAADAGLYRVIVSNDRGVVTSPEVELQLRPAVSGDVRWDFGAGYSGVLAPPALGTDGTVYGVFAVGTGCAAGAVVCAIDSETGLARWSAALPEGSCNPANDFVGVSDLGVVIVHHNGSLIAFEAFTGRESWRVSGMQTQLGIPVVGPDGTVYSTESPFGMAVTVSAFDGASGATRWRRSLGTAQGWVSWLSMGPDGVLYVCGGDRTVYALDSTTGNQRWAVPVSDSPSAAALDSSGGLYVGTADGSMKSIKTLDGSSRWQTSLVNGIRGSPVVDGTGRVYLWDVRSNLVALAADTGERMWIRAVSSPTAGGDVADSPALTTDGSLCVVGYTEQTLFVLDSTTGSNRWVWAVANNSKPIQTAVGPDGTIYVSTELGRLYAVAGAGAAPGSGWSMFGCDASRQGRLGRTGKPRILRRLVDSEVDVGAGVVLEVTADGVHPMQYRWFKDGVELLGTSRIRGTDGRRLMLDDCQIGDAGSFSVLVSNAEGSELVEPVRLSVRQPSPGAPRWTLAGGTPRRYSGEPAMGIDTSQLLYLPSRDGRMVPGLTAIEVATGRERWTYSTARAAAEAAVGSDGSVYFGTDDGHLYALDGVTGAAKWTVGVADGFSTGPSVGQDGHVLFGGRNGQLYCFDGATGAKRWSSALAGMPRGAPSFGPDGTVYCGAGNQLIALEGTTGVKRWSILHGFGSGPGFSEDGYLCVSDRGGIVLLDPQTGLRRTGAWFQSPTASAVSAGANEMLFCGGGNTSGGQPGKVYAVDGRTGTLRWTFSTGSGPYQDGVRATPTLAADGTLYVAGPDQKVYAIEATTGMGRWQTDVGTRMVSSVGLAADGTLIVVGEDGSVHAIVGSSPLARTPWPKLRGDSRCSGAMPNELPMPPVIVEDISDAVVTNRQPVSLSVKVTGSKPFGYQWYLGSLPVNFGIAPRETKPSLDIPSLQSDLIVRLQITNFWGAVTSRMARITVMRSPWISQQPKDQLLSGAASASLEVVAGGGGLGYQWFMASEGKPASSVPNGREAAIITPPLYQTTDFWVVVTNAAGSIQSRTARVTVRMEDPPPALQLSMPVPGRLRLHIPVGPGSRWRLLRSSDLVIWNAAVDQADLEGGADPLVLDLSATAEVAEFFRVEQVR